VTPYRSTGLVAVARRHVGGQREAQGVGQPRVVVSDVIIDCSDPEALAKFWSALLGRPAGPRTGPYVALDRAADCDIGIGFQYVAGLEPKSQKNRVHFDISAADASAEDIPATVALVESLGGRRVPGYESVGFLVMADPEGNEFCIVSVAPVDVDEEGHTRYLEGLDLGD
jgi:predicted enzyme related to lactoylglutathione lyase